jgi:hypothetical protein
MLETIIIKKAEIFSSLIHKNSFLTTIGTKNRRWRRRRSTLRIENRFFGKALSLSLNVALFE